MDYKIISADSHLEIPIDRWVHRVPDEHRERAPRGIKLANGGDAWLIEGRPLWAVGLELSGRPRQQYQPTGLSYDGAAGAGTGEQRLSEMTRDGVDAEVLFPGVGGANFWRGIALDDAYRAVIHAYNEFLVEDYVVADPQRLLALGLIPETGLDEALDELRFCARGGLKGVCLNGWPCGRSYPTLEDDIFWREAMDLGIAVTVHIQLRYGAAAAGPSYPYPKAPPPDIHPQASDPLRHIAAFDRRGGLNALQLVFAGTFDRLPDFRIYFAETYIGWLPIFFEQADMLYDQTIHWANDYVGLPTLDRLPSEYLRHFIYWGFVNDPFGVKVRHDVGVDRAMWSSDFPHSVTTWPDSIAAIDAMFDGVPADETARMVCGNAIDFFSLGSS